MKKLILRSFSLIFTVATAYEVNSRFGDDEASSNKDFQFGGYNVQFQPSAQFSGGFQPFPFSIGPRLPNHKSSSDSPGSRWSFTQSRGDPSHGAAEIPSSSFDFSDPSRFRGNKNSPVYFRWNQNDGYVPTNADRGFGGFGFDRTNRFGDNGRSHSTNDRFPDRERFIGQFPDGKGLWSHDRIPPYFFIYPTLNKGCPGGGGDGSGFTTEQSSSTVSTDAEDITTDSGIDGVTEDDEDFPTATEEDTDENEGDDGVEYVTTEAAEIPNTESGEGEIRESENVGEETKTEKIEEEQVEKDQP